MVADCVKVPACGDDDTFTVMEIFDLGPDMLTVALGIVNANAAFVVANTGFVVATVEFP